MDEITPESGFVIPVDGADNNPLYELIDGLVDDAVLELFSVAPFWRLVQTPFDEEDEIAIGTVGDRKFLRLKVNDSFLRIAEINCSEFYRPITEVVPEQSDLGRRQHNRFLMAKEAKPVGVISHGVWDDEQCREIDCYSFADEPDEVYASYIAKPASISSTPSDTDAVEDVVPHILIPALEWLNAARAFGARGDTNHAAVCQQNAQNLLV